MTGLNTKVNDCKAGMGWHGYCLFKGQGEQTMTVKAICLTHKTPISIRGIVYMANNCEILVIEEPKQEDK